MHEATRHDLITEEFLEILRQNGVVQANLYGSTAAGTNRPDSDIDLLVDFASEVTLFQQLELAEKLSKVSGRHVDLVSKLHPLFEPYIIPTLKPLPL